MSPAPAATSKLKSSRSAKCAARQPWLRLSIARLKPAKSCASKQQPSTKPCGNSSSSPPASHPSATADTLSSSAEGSDFPQETSLNRPSHNRPSLTLSPAKPLASHLQGEKKMNASDMLIETLMDWGVNTVFGLPGDGINGIMEALRVRQDKVRFIQVRHEESAAFMACAYAKYTGKLGVCLATSGPGGIHLLNGLYDAKLDGAPVLAITGMQFHDLIGTMTQQDVALDKTFLDVAQFNERVMGPTHVEPLTDLACRMAFSYRTVSHLCFPVDVQEMEVSRRKGSKRNVPHHTSHEYARSARLPDPIDLREAANILNEGKKVAILAGRGAHHATEELILTADTLGAPIIKALLGKDRSEEHTSELQSPCNLVC